MKSSQRNFDAMIAPNNSQLASPMLHRVLSLPSIQEHIYGGKCVGSGGDGTAQLVARSAADREVAMEKISAAFPQMRCFPLTIEPQMIRGTAPVIVKQ